MGVMTIKGYSAFPKAPAFLIASPSNCFVSYPGHLMKESYLSAGMQPGNSTAQADWGYLGWCNGYQVKLAYHYLWVRVSLFAHLYGLVPHLNKKLSKLLYKYIFIISSSFRQVFSSSHLMIINSLPNFYTSKSYII